MRREELWYLPQDWKSSLEIRRENVHIAEHVHAEFGHVESRCAFLRGEKDQTKAIRVVKRDFGVVLGEAAWYKSGGFAYRRSRMERQQLCCC